MSVMGDGGSLSDVNQPFKPETEECGAIPGLADSSRSVGGERCEATAVTELIVGATAEMNESPVVVAGKAAEEEGVGGAMFAQCEASALEMIAKEESGRADDSKREDAEAMEAFIPEVDTKQGKVVSQPETKVETKADQEFTQVVDPEAGLLDADVDDTQQFSELEMDAIGNEMEALYDKAVGQVSDGKKNEADVVAENDRVDEEKVGAGVSDTEVWDGENAVGVEEEKSDVPLIAEDIPITRKEANECGVGIGEQKQIPESSGSIGDREEGLMFATKMVEDESMDMDILLKGPTLNKPVNIAENKDEVSKEDCLLEEDAEQGIEAKTEKVELEVNVVLKEAQLENVNVLAAEGTEVVDDKSPDSDGKMDTEETNSDEADEPHHDLHDLPAALEEKEGEAIATKEETGSQYAEMVTETDIPDPRKSSAEKRKLSNSPISIAATKSSSKKAVGEDVCFICFDGGELVLCDRRGCPKAYHPSCVNRDEAFFKSKGRWNCGWHLCSICEKDARYTCCTCTFSLCKSCIKDAVILCVRGNKGFCEPCMKIVELIENNEQGNGDTQVDFNDRSSWEFLFKDYYVELKAKLSLSSVDIAEAKNPWKGPGMLSGPSKRESPEAPADANDGGSGSDNSFENTENIRPKRRKTRKQPRHSDENNSEWASKELLEFVSHMKDGDTTFLSQFDVQALLLDYIKVNKLRDPRRKSQIICDARLGNLFGKPRVGHFEMLKLLESHFLVKDEQNDDFQGSVVDTENNQLDVDDSAEPMTKGVKDRKRKLRKKSSRGTQSNLGDYAAIDMHNIGLIYMRRKLVEDLLEEAEMFHDKIIGTFVRIRISGSNQKQDLYRLVPVVGTSKGAEPYKIGKKSTDTMVEILNLDKTEVISIDTISNQEFTEEECKRLRQSIKCGLIRRLTVGEILDKTVEIQNVKVNDWLESEVLRLSHLRDRASDLGRRKELRECVEKLQILKTPEERKHRLDKIPEIHADPKMDPSYESDDNDSENEESRRDAFMKSKGINRRGRPPISPGSDNSTKPTNKIWEASKYASNSSFSINPSHIGEIVNENSWNSERKETEEPRNLQVKQNSATITEFSDRPSHPVSRPESFPGATPSTVTSQTSFSAEADETPAKINESEKMWHYKDPSGKVQGPFSIVQLRKWNKTGYFPADLKIWRAVEKEENSIPLADALVGKFKFPKELPVVGNIMSGPNKERSNMDTTSLPSPTPKRGKGSNSGLNEGERGFIAGAIHENASGVNVNELLSSPTPVVPNMGSLSSLSPAAVVPNMGTPSVTNPVIQTASFSPTLAQSIPTSELSPQTVHMHARGPQPQVYFGGAQNSSGSFSNPTGGPQRPPPITPNATWGQWPTESNAPMGVRPENTNTGWGNPNMGSGNGNGPANMNWGPSPMPAPMQSYGNPNPNWGAPIQGPVMGNWGPPSGNVGSPLPPMQGNQNQGFGRPNNMGGQFSDQRGGRGGPRPWTNRQPPFGGGSGGFRKSEVVCPYNQNGRCRKGSQCDYMHT